MEKIMKYPNYVYIIEHKPMPSHDISNNIKLKDKLDTT